MSSRPDYFWIDTPQALMEFTRALDPALPLTIDIEADSLHHYREKLCLVAVAHGHLHVLIDALAIKDWSSVWPYWRRHTWIFHGMDYDLKMLRQVGANPPEEIFDTMLAGQLLHLPAVGYAALVERYFSVELNKSSQREDWSKRPLPQKMIDYAILDVSYLQPLAEKIQEDLRKHDRLQWHQQTCRRIMKLSFYGSTSLINDEDEASKERWRIRGSRDLPVDALSILKALWHWREREAERRDLPVFKVLHNHQLLDLARWSLHTQNLSHWPRSLYWLTRYPQLEKEIRNTILSARKAEHEKHPPSPPRIRGNPDFEANLQILKRVRDTAAHQHHLSPSLIASKQILSEIARDPQRAPQQLLENYRWATWQKELLEPAIQEIISK